MRSINLKLSNAILVPVAMVMLVGSLPVQAAGEDQRIETSAKNSYNFKTYLKDDKIKVASADGVVTLSGTVAREHHKSLAQDTVAGMAGVKSVINQLVVVGDQPADKSDAWMTMKVKSVLAFHKSVSAMDTEVTTDKGVVTLTGKADSAAQKALTGEYAKDVDGVVDVHNNLVVTKGAKRTFSDKVDDSSITVQVKTTLLFHKSTHALATKVSTKDGVVSLDGEAKNGAERELVTKLVEDVRGVKQVRNRMTVK